MSINVFTVRNSKKNFDKLSVVLINKEGTKKTVNFIGKGSIKLTVAKKEMSDAEMELFVPINDYFNVALSEVQQEELFMLYEQAQDIIENGEFVSYQKEIKRLEPILFDLFELIKPASLMNFFEFSSKYMIIPKDLKKTTGHGYYPQETTFVVEDYIDLVKLLFLVRAVYPIFFGLLYRLESITGQSYAELQAGTLLSKSHHITETKGWKRLNSYVQHSYQKNSQNNTSIDVGSTEHTMVMILYRIVFNRLSMAMVPETDPGKSIINAISSEVKQFENNIGGYRAKAPRGEEEDNGSYLDDHQLSEDVSSSKITLMAEFFAFGLRDEKDKERFTKRFFYQCNALGIKNEPLVDMVYDNFPTVWKFQLTSPMRVLLQLTYAGDVSERIYDHCDYLQLTAAIALAQVKLAEKGYVYLPSLLCAQKKSEDFSVGNAFLQLTADDRSYLGEICDVQTKNNEGSSFNEAALFVKEFFEELEGYRWVSNLEYGVLDNPEVYKKVSKGELFDLDIGVEIKQELLSLIKEINQ